MNQLERIWISDTILRQLKFLCLKIRQRVKSYDNFKIALEEYSKVEER